MATEKSENEDQDKLEELEAKSEEQLAALEETKDELEGEMEKLRNAQKSLEEAHKAVKNALTQEQEGSKADLEKLQDTYQEKQREVLGIYTTLAEMHERAENQYRDYQETQVDIAYLEGKLDGLEEAKKQTKKAPSTAETTPETTPASTESDLSEEKEEEELAQEEEEQETPQEAEKASPPSSPPFGAKSVTVTTPERRLAGIEEFLAKLKEEKIISDYKVSEKGFNVTMSNGDKFTLDGNKLTVYGKNYESYKTAVQSVQAQGATSLDLSKLTNATDKENYYRAAQDANPKLTITGLDPQEMNKLQQKYGPEPLPSPQPN